jgi:hypothetical protein
MEEKNQADCEECSATLAESNMPLKNTDITGKNMIKKEGWMQKKGRFFGWKSYWFELDEMTESIQYYNRPLIEVKILSSFCNKLFDLHLPFLNYIDRVF